jgi:hypothetical protein
LVLVFGLLLLLRRSTDGDGGGNGDGIDTVVEFFPGFAFCGFFLVGLKPLDSIFQ